MTTATAVPLGSERAARWRLHGRGRADPAALVMVPVVVREGLRGVRGESSCECAA